MGTAAHAQYVSPHGGQVRAEAPGRDRGRGRRGIRWGGGAAPEEELAEQVSAEGFGVLAGLESVATTELAVWWSNRGLFEQNDVHIVHTRTRVMSATSNSNIAKNKQKIVGERRKEEKRGRKKEGSKGKEGRKGGGEAQTDMNGTGSVFCQHAYEKLRCGGQGGEGRKEGNGVERRSEGKPSAAFRSKERGRERARVRTAFDMRGATRGILPMSEVGQKGLRARGGP